MIARMETYRALNYTKGRAGRKLDRIVLHHWGAFGQSFTGIIDWFCYNRNCPTSCHYVVGDGRVAKIASESDTTWHAGNWDANCRSIGIECKPEKSATDQALAAQVVVSIWRRYGKLPIYEHRQIVGTSCPGNWSAKELTNQAEAIYYGTKIDKGARPQTSAKAKQKIVTKYKPLTVQEAIKLGQEWSNQLIGTNIAEDGICGPETQKNAVKMVQWAANKDYGQGLVIDGLLGPATNSMLWDHYVKYGGGR